MIKKFVTFLITISLFLLSFGCFGLFGHEVYNDLKDYEKIFKLNELRYDFYCFKLFPKSVDKLNVKRFYCEWKLDFVGSAEVEIQLTVKYTPQNFASEIDRIINFEYGKPVYDTTHFSTPAYILALGFNNTSWYAVINESKFEISYCLLQLLPRNEIDINEELIPKGYHNYGEVVGVKIGVVPNCL